MKSGLRVLLALTCAISIGSGIASAEELHVIKGESINANAIVVLDGVNVYAVLEGGLLVGGTPERINSLKKEGIPVRSVERVGERDMGSEYYFFQIAKGDVERLSPEIDLVYYDGKEAIARIAKGSGIDPESHRLIRGLTHIAFIPKPPVKQGTFMRAFDPVRNATIQEIVNQVSEAEYTAFIQRMQDFATRYSYTDSCRAAELWAIDTFASFGLETELFPFNGGAWNNAIGRKIGKVYPDSIYMIIGHLDATSENPYNSAPGAEDNASGSACVLEAARVLSQYDFNCTIEFVLVTGEEQGLVGSEAYATYCFVENRGIGGVLNFDMISYAGSYGWDTNIYSDQNFPAEVALADLLGELTDLYSDAYSIRVNTIGPVSGSDHYYFSFYGFPAPFSIDAQLWGAPDWYPWYHTVNDVITNLDLDFGTEVVKGGVAAMATIATLAEPPLLTFSYPNGRPELIDPTGGTTFRVEVHAGTMEPEPGTGVLYYNDGGGFRNVPMEIVAPNVYDAVFPVVDCGVDILYFVGAETIDGTPVTDPLNAPTITYSAFGASNLITLFEDDFESDQGWTVVNDCQSGEWERGVPVIGEFRGQPLEDADGSGQCYLTENRIGDSDVDDGYTWLISPAFDLEGIDAMISYSLWYTNNFGNDPYNDLFKVWVSNDNGTNWVLAETIGPITSAGWKDHSFYVDDFVTPTAQVKVRFEASDLNEGSVVEAGIDAVKVILVECGGPPDVSVTITPDNPPIIVPPGGLFTFDGSLTNNTNEEVYADAWIMVDVPGFGTYGPVFQIEDIRLPAGQTLSRMNIRQSIPSRAPEGLYTYTAYTGFYPSSPSDSSSFEFTVTSGADDQSGEFKVSDWLMD